MADDTKRMKIRDLMRKKPIVRGLSIESIDTKLWEIMEECDEVRDLIDCDESILDGWDGDEEEAETFKTMISVLAYDCEKMREDLEGGYGYVPDCFDTFFLAAKAAEDYGGVVYYDECESDYYGLDAFTASYVEEQALKKIERMTKSDIIQAAVRCFAVYQAFTALTYRYDCLKAVIDIIKGRNIELMQTVKNIEEAYEKANYEEFNKYSPAVKELDRLLERVPEEIWV